MTSFQQLIEELVEQELDEVNAIGAGGVSATGGGPLGQNMSPAHQKMWSGDKPLKKRKVQEGNLADKMGLKKATDQVRRGVVGGSPVYMDRHDGDEAGTKKVMGKVAKNLNRKPYSKKPPMMGLTETRFGITPEQAQNWDLMKSLDIWQGNDNFGIYLRFRGKNTLQLDIAASNGSRTYAAIYPNKRQIVLVVESHSWRISPIFAEIVATLSQQIPDLNSFALYAYDEHNQPASLDMTLAQAAQQVRQVSIRSQDYNPKDAEVTYKEFKVHILDDLQDLDWYHATRAQNVENIMAKGLLPSGEFEQGGGWTQFNLNLQNAVYLTADPNYADQIAETLASRFNEPAVVLKIQGGALADKSKITLDEDSLLSKYDDMIDYTNYEHELPSFYTSVIHRIQSIGYAGVIPPSFISVDETIQPEPPEDNSDWNSSQDDDGVVSSRYA